MPSRIQPPAGNQTQWLDAAVLRCREAFGRAQKLLEKRLDTAAGPSRIRTGFPVCRRKAAAILRPPATLVECTDRVDLVKEMIRRRDYRQGFPTVKTRWKDVTVVPTIDGSTVTLVRVATAQPSRATEPSSLARCAP